MDTIDSLLAGIDAGAVPAGMFSRIWAAAWPRPTPSRSMSIR